MSTKKWNKIGSLRTSANGKRNLILEKNVEILIDGVAIDLGEFRTAKCFDSVDSLNLLLQNGKITQEALTKRLDYVQEKGIKFDVVVPPRD